MCKTCKQKRVSQIFRSASPIRRQRTDCRKLTPLCGLLGGGLNFDGLFCASRGVPQAPIVAQPCTRKTRIGKLVRLEPPALCSEKVARAVWSHFFVRRGDSFPGSRTHADRASSPRHALSVHPCVCIYMCVHTSAQLRAAPPAAGPLALAAATMHGGCCLRRATLLVGACRPHPNDFYSRVHSQWDTSQGGRGGRPWPHELGKTRKHSVALCGYLRMSSSDGPLALLWCVFLPAAEVELEAPDFLGSTDSMPYSWALSPATPLSCDSLEAKSYLEA